MKLILVDPSRHGKGKDKTKVKHNKIRSQENGISKKLHHLPMRSHQTREPPLIFYKFNPNNHSNGFGQDTYLTGTLITRSARTVPGAVDGTNQADNLSYSPLKSKFDSRCLVIKTDPLYNNSNRDLVSSVKRLGTSCNNKISKLTFINNTLTHDLNENRTFGFSDKYIPLSDVKKANDLEKMVPIDTNSLVNIVLQSIERLSAKTKAEDNESNTGIVSANPDLLKTGIDNTLPFMTRTFSSDVKLKPRKVLQEQIGTRGYSKFKLRIKDNADNHNDTLSH
ncbi:uncharacterized protein NDAI_0I02050 [Naumovozyma dairenensis CBS 421]|uniref:Uncharacterized protein n=1 Tax=Naumovozyma dairenensis (strain ATCC 10597 / BCRC 20456 / CBS 421 / NBRC 0211 / NRRL Y-12639) TaxID=1071378 RepID=G0WG63_NAUDC|nr:hypothetical protein NDAI_0I02050 [Naumovozyma dairenensis CBS 421]CCD26774.1 hypothetical protein NDAI_0I02050 [Naumovozyma dairenensis CBS 421]